MLIFKAEQLLQIGTKIFIAAGVPVDEAELVSKFLVKANMSGHDSHGVIRIIQYMKDIERGTIKPASKTEVVREIGSTAILNGNWGLGQVVASRAMKIAIEKAKKNSVGIVCIYNCNHIGRLADYTMMASQSDMIGVAMVNSSKSVAPYGGRERLLSTGPISYAFPTNGVTPFILDIATSVGAEGKVRVALHKGDKLPEGWIIDKDGNSSQNPEDFYKGGALLPFGGDVQGYKGFGLGFVVDVLGGILSGASCAYETGKRGNGVFFETIDIQSFMPVDEFKEKMGNFIQKIKSSQLRPGFKEIMIPGEPEYKTEKRRLEEGIPMPEKTWEEIIDIAKKLNLDITSLQAF